MSQENVEIVRGILDTWEQGDFRTAADLFAPDVTSEAFMPDATHNLVARGLAEVKLFTRDLLAQWRAYRIVAEEFKDVSGGKVTGLSLDYDRARALEAAGLRE
jgi:ketosteroid isomerase-like protein